MCIDYDSDLGPHLLFILPFITFIWHCGALDCRPCSRWIYLYIHQIRSVAQSCPTLCDPMNRSTPGLPIHHQLPEFTQTHIHRVSDVFISPWYVAGQEAGRREEGSGWGTHVCLWRIHFDIWQNYYNYVKFKNKIKLKKNKKKNKKKQTNKQKKRSNS